MILSTLVIACSPSLEETWEWDDTLDSGKADTDTDTGQNIIDEPFFQVNATDYDNWVYLALEEEEIFLLYGTSISFPPFFFKTLITFSLVFFCIPFLQSSP